MSKGILQILCLAAMSDGILHDTEKVLINTYRNFYPSLKSLSNEEFDQAINEISNQSHNIKPKYLIGHVGDNLTQQEKNSAYALAVEICASNFQIVLKESEFLRTMIEVWDIDDATITSVDDSIRLRYNFSSIN